MIIHCPRCKQLACKVWKHKHNRFACPAAPDATCPEYEAQCQNSFWCEYPAPKGWRSLPTLIWVRGKYVSERVRQICEAPIEPLPPPFNRRYR